MHSPKITLNPAASERIHETYDVDSSIEAIEASFQKIGRIPFLKHGHERSIECTSVGDENDVCIILIHRVSFMIDSCIGLEHIG